MKLSALAAIFTFIAGSATAADTEFTFYNDFGGEGDVVTKNIDPSDLGGDPGCITKFKQDDDVRVKSDDDDEVYGLYAYNTEMCTGVRKRYQTEEAEELDGDTFDLEEGHDAVVARVGACLFEPDGDPSSTATGEGAVQTISDWSSAWL